MDENQQFEALHELKQITDLNHLRQLVAQTAVQRTVLELWDPCSSKAEAIWKSESVKNAYRRLVKIDFYSPEIEKVNPVDEAMRRNEQYHQILDFRGCPVDTSILTPLKPQSFLSLPRDLFNESASMRTALFSIYGKQSPLSDDLA